MIQQRRSRAPWALMVLIVVALIVAAGYVALLRLTPVSGEAFLTGRTSGETIEKLKAAPGANGNRLYIPKINVDIAIGDGTTEAMRQASGSVSPVSGNFILTASRFTLGTTPQLTAAGSPFYHLDELTSGDQLVVDFDGQRYNYVVGEATASTANPATLTLYATTDTGSKDGATIQAAAVNDVVYHQS